MRRFPIFNILLPPWEKGDTSGPAEVASASTLPGDTKTAQHSQMTAKKRSPILPVDDLTEKQAKAEHARLAAEIGEHDRRYYQDDAPSVSDAAYDALRQRYNAIEARFPDLKTLDSLSRRVGASPSARFAKVRHAVPMLSLDNAFSDEDVADFVGRIRRFSAAAGRGGDRVYRRAEDRRPVDVAALRGRRPGAPARRAATAPKARTSPPM